jgi:P-type Ca2+ transporter type 2C
MLGAALCNDASLKPGNRTRPEATGDPTEAALIVAAAQVGLYEPAAIWQRISELPFDSGRKRMTTVHRLSLQPELPATLRSALLVVPENYSFIAFTKGAVESLVQVCDRHLQNNHAVELAEKARSEIIEASNRLANQGKRVLGVAFRLMNALPDKSELERNLVFIGMIALSDPPRKAVKEAVCTCQLAGIRPLMITGDHPMTASYIGRVLGFTARVLSGPELERMPLHELEEASDDVSIYARVIPEQKLKIVQALQNRGQIVAMTGDGVNDAPAAESILGRGIGPHILWVGCLMGLVPLCTGWFYWRQDNPAWQTMVFSLLTFGQIFQTLARTFVARIGIR